MSLVSNPRAVVTGGASGLGRALCLALARRGAKIVVADRDRSGAEETERQVRAAGATAHSYICDVSNSQEVEQLAMFADQQLGGVDLLVNNAGVSVTGTVGDVSLRDWEWIVGVNLWGTIHGCQAFIPRLRRQGKGHIVNVASVGGLLCFPTMGPYNVTKAGIVALSETMAAELKSSNVGVTVVCPNAFSTNLATNSRGLDADQTAMVTRRMGESKVQADDVARAVLAACERNELYVLPMSAGQWMWRLKRLMPERYHTKLMPKALERLAGKEPAPKAV